MNKKWVKIVSVFMVLLIALSAFAGCGMNISKKKCTVLLYLCGGTSESGSGSASANIEELLKAQYSADINFVIQAGGTKEWKREGISTDTLGRYAVTAGGLELVDSQGLASMGSAQTLGDFIAWGKENYPARAYILLFSGESAGAPGGLCFDELYENDSLALPELSEGLERGDTKFECIGFDTGLMACLETASAISKYGKYMVASEEYMQSGGWNFQALYTSVAAGRKVNGLDIGKEICDAYFKGCQADDTSDMATMSVLDLSKISDVTDAFAKMADKMTSVLSDASQIRTFKQNAIKSEQYGACSEQEGYANMVDLGDIAEKTRTVLGEDISKGILDTIACAAAYKVSGARRAYGKGISFFYPFSVTDTVLTQYADVCMNPDYLKCVQFLGGDTEIEGLETIELKDYDLDFSTRVTSWNNYSLDITEGLDAVASVEMRIYRKESDEYWLMGYNTGIDTNWITGSFKDDFNGKWLTINGEICSSFLIAQEEEYSLYSIPVRINGQEASIRAAYVWDDFGTTGHYEICGVYDGADSRGVSGVGRRLKSDDEITFICSVYDSALKEKSTGNLGKITAGKTPGVKDATIQDGEYKYQFIITDVFGNTYNSSPAVMIREKGEMTLSIR